jgi:hypothetical protein
MSFPDIQTNGNSMVGVLDLTFCVVDSSTTVFLETDGNHLPEGDRLSAACVWSQHSAELAGFRLRYRSR